MTPSRSASGSRGCSRTVSRSRNPAARSQCEPTACACTRTLPERCRSRKQCATPSQKPCHRDRSEVPMGKQEVVTPVPGTFYRRPDPEAEPFKIEGDAVEAGETIGLVEIMKNFQE